MRTNRRFLANRMLKVAKTRTETRDAKLYDIQGTQRQCRCFVDDSDEYIIAWYPENWEAIPPWLKPGNSVTIRHTGGNRGRIEVIGPSFLIPAGAPTAPIINGPDCVYEGCQVTTIIAEPQMVVFVRIGRFRIFGVIYELDPIKMTDDNSTLLRMSMMAPINVIADVIGIDVAPPLKSWRYDLIVVGTDKVIDYIKGVESTAEPVMPDTPAAHIKLDHILVSGEVTEIHQNVIGQFWDVPTAVQVTISASVERLSWGVLTSTITVSLFDQDSNPVYRTGPGWWVVLSLASGNGTVSFGLSSSTTLIKGNTGPDSHQVVFTYTRDNLGTDISPVLKAELHGDMIFSLKYIILLNESNVPMI